MKTNQIMTRGEFEKIQRTKDSYFNADALLDKYNLINPLKKKSMKQYKAAPATKEFINFLKSDRNIKNPIIATRGRNAINWMHPLLFIDFAMYLSVEFKTTILEWILDGLIKVRHQAGDFYNEMTKAISEVYLNTFNKKPPATIYKKEANLLKEISGIFKNRNTMTEEELWIIYELEKQNTFLIYQNIGKKSRIKRLKDYMNYLNKTRKN